MRNLGDDKKLKKLVNDPKQLEKELFEEKNYKGENINPSAQEKYPGPGKTKSSPSNK